MLRADRRRFLADLLVAVPALHLVPPVARSERRAPRDDRQPPAATAPQPAAPQPTAAGVMVAAGEDRFHAARTVGVSATAFKVAADDTRQALFAMEQANTKHGGPPLHVHHDVDEFWFVTAGQYVIEVGGRQFHAGPGDCVLGPRSVPHRWAFMGDAPGRVLITFTPAGRMQEFFALFRTPGVYLNDPALARRFGMELLGPPLPV